jgi:tRNA dimethylallyltransferase
VNDVTIPIKPDLLAVVGATATGKTAMGVELAQALDGEIVNCDSRLFYRGMDIATAKPTPEEMKSVPHHLLDFIDPGDEYSLASYVKQARTLIDEITQREKLPILVGGTGQYVWALVEGWEVPEIEPDFQLRAELERRLGKDGVEPLANELTQIAPEIAANTDLLNPRRVIRAIERVRSNPSSSAANNRRKAHDEPFNAHIIGLAIERSVLHQRVTDRLETMLANGWVAEIESLLEAGYTADNRALSGIGYRQMIAHIEGEYDLDEAVRLTAVATNRLIRHQNNWFKQDDPRINWVDMTNDPEEGTNSVIEAAIDWRN